MIYRFKKHKKIYEKTYALLHNLCFCRQLKKVIIFFINSPAIEFRVQPFSYDNVEVFIGVFHKLLNIAIMESVIGNFIEHIDQSQRVC